MKNKWLYLLFLTVFFYTVLSFFSSKNKVWGGHKICDPEKVECVDTAVCNNGCRACAKDGSGWYCPDSYWCRRCLNTPTPTPTNTPTPTPTQCQPPPIPQNLSPANNSKFEVVWSIPVPVIHQANSVSATCGSNNPEYQLSYSFNGSSGICPWSTAPSCNVYYNTPGISTWRFQSRIYDSYYSTYRESALGTSWNVRICEKEKDPSCSVSSDCCMGICHPLIFKCELSLSSEIISINLTPTLTNTPTPTPTKTPTPTSTKTPINTPTPTQCQPPPIPQNLSPANNSEAGGVFPTSVPVFHQANSVSATCGSNNPEYQLSYSFNGSSGICPWSTVSSCNVYYNTPGISTWRFQSRIYDSYYSTYRESALGTSWNVKICGTTGASCSVSSDCCFGSVCNPIIFKCKLSSEIISTNTPTPTLTNISIPTPTKTPTPTPTKTPTPTLYPTVAIHGDLKEYLGGGSCSEAHSSSLLIRIVPQNSQGINSTCDITPVPASYFCSLVFDNQRYQPTPAQTLTLNVFSGVYTDDYYWSQDSCINTGNRTINVDVRSSNTNFLRNIFFQTKSWIKLKDASFSKYTGNLTNPIPSTVTAYDSEDSQSSVFIEGSAGLIAAQTINLSSGNASSNNWTISNYSTNKIYSQDVFASYIQSRKDNQVTSLDTNLSSEKINVVQGNLVVNNTNINNLIGNITLFVDGDVEININGIFNTGGSLAIISKGKITFAPSVTEAHGLFIADTIETGKTTNQGLKIIGNMVAFSNFINNRQWKNKTKPSVFVVFDAKVYLDLLEQLSVAKYEWRQLQ